MRIRDIIAATLTPLGRHKLRTGIFRKLWPALRILAIFYRQSLLRRTRVVVVVGSFGKTTTARMISSVLDVRVFAGGNAFDSIVAAIMHVRPGARHAVIEVGVDASGQMAVYAKMLQPDVVVVTSVGSSHNRSFATLEATRDEKAVMVRCLPPSGLVVLNGDDSNVLWMQSQTKARIVTFGFDEANDVRGSDMSLSTFPGGTSFIVHVGGQSRQMYTQLIGSPGVNAALAAIAVALAEGLTLDEIVHRLDGLVPTPGRLQPVPLANGAVILRDDFKSELETVSLALDVLAQIPARRRIVVLGLLRQPQGNLCDLYRNLGERVAAVACRAIFLCGEHDSECGAGAVHGGMSPEAIMFAGDNLLKVVEVLKQDLGPGDVVLVKGAAKLQRLERITLTLQGRNVQCQIKHCKISGLACSECPALEKE